MRKISILLIISILIGNLFVFTACDGKDNKTVPSLKEEDGWHQTLNTDFSTYNNMEELYQENQWTYSTHGKRFYEYWCNKNLSMDKTENTFKVESRIEHDHDCDVCGIKDGVFTGGIETRKTETNEGFYQAFGYYEVVAKVPDAPGMWSAFWIHTDDVRKIGNKGVDGTEIDIYESSFHEKNRTKTGSALHYDAYDAPWYRCKDNIADVGYDLYDYSIDKGYGKGYHKYSLHWTPKYYAFFVDDTLTWTTDGGGVSRIPSFLRLTVEIRDVKYGPYGQKIGIFENRTDGSTDYHVKSVKVWQKDEYKPYIMESADFKDMEKEYTIGMGIGSAIGIIVLIAGITCLSLYIKKKKQQ